MSNQTEMAERFDKVGGILDELYLLTDRTHGLADLLTQEIPQESLGIHLAFQIEVNTKEIERLLYEALRVGWPKSGKEVAA